MEEEKLTYEDALGEIADIVSRLESSETKLSEIETAIARAEHLIAFCQSRIREVDTSCSEIISRILDNQAPTEE